MKKNNFITKLYNSYFHPSLDLRVQVFNLLGLAGIILGLFSALDAMIAFDPWHIILNLTASGFGSFVLYITRRTGKYRLCFLLTVIVVFFIIFPLLFFTGNGYGGAMPYFFIVAIIFTGIMLEGKTRIILVPLLSLTYIGCILIEYFILGTFAHYPNEITHMLSILSTVVLVGLILFTVFMMYIRIYDNRQKQLEEIDRVKTEFFQNMHHEMKTPLNVINTYIQSANVMLENDIDKSAVILKLETAQQEIIRLARMVENSLDLAAAQIKQQQMEPIDFVAFLRAKAGMFTSVFQNSGNTLHIKIPEALPSVLGNADLLSQLIFNLMYNAAKHTQDGKITVSLEQTGQRLTGIIKDTGEGITAENQLNIFQRGASSGGTGYGLSICKTIIEMHNGDINIESQPGKGTAVTFTLPCMNEIAKISTKL